MHRSFMLFPGSLKLPMDTYLHVFRREVSCYHARTRAKISSDVLGPKMAISQFQIQKLPGGTCPQTPLASVYTQTYALGCKYR